MKCEPVGNFSKIKFKLQDKTVDMISKRTKLSTEELYNLSLDEQVTLMNQRGSLKKKNPVKAFIADKYKKFGEKFGLLSKESNTYTHID